MRFSYGTTGNDQLAPYQYLTSWQATSFPYQGNAGLRPVRIANPDYSWEVNRKFEIALELGLFRERLLMKLNYFRNRSSNQLVASPLPLSTGFSSIQYNLPALIENRGFEFEFNSEVLRGKNVSWAVDFNFTIPKNKLLRFPDIDNSNYIYFYEVGKPLGIYKGFHLTGVDPQTGVYQFEDINGDGNANPNFPLDLTAKK